MLDESTGGTSSETRSASKVLMAVMACLHRSRDEDRPLLLSAAAPSIPESRSCWAMSVDWLHTVNN